MKFPRIGLIRHFEVKKSFPSGWLSWEDLIKWREEDELSEVHAGEIDLGGIHWRHCFSSDMPRAYLTAQSVFPGGGISQLPELREPHVGNFRTGKLRLPYFLWKQLLRIAWMSSHSSQRAAKEAFMAKIRHIVAEVVLKAQEDTLIVSHAGVMMFLRKELVKLGYAGPGFKIAQNGRLYVFERKAAFVEQV